MDMTTQVLTGLVDRTTDGKLEWRSALGRNAFLATVDLIGVIIKPSGGSSNGQRGYSLEILNNEGLIAEVLATDADYAAEIGARSITDDQREMIIRLFHLARRSALNTDATMSELASRLEEMRRGAPAKRASAPRRLLPIRRSP